MLPSFQFFVLKFPDVIPLPVIIMKTKTALLLGLFWLFAAASFSQDAPVVSSGSALYAAKTFSAVTIPVSVKSFTDIGYFQLTMNYPVSKVTYQGGTGNAVFGSLTINGSTPGTITITWTGTYGVTLPDGSNLVVLTFTYVSGVADLTWATSGSSCLFKKYSGGAFTVLNDLPKTDHYKNGVVTYASPVVQAPYIDNAQNGTVSVPITVTNYTSIAAGTLYFSYDTAVLTYQSFVAHPSVAGYFMVGSPQGIGGSRKLMVINWMDFSGLGVTLPYGSILCTLNFNFSNQDKTYTTLSWYDNGGSCSFNDVQWNQLYDTPQSAFFKDGLVACSVSPKTLLPVISNAPVSPLSTSVPVKVSGFSNIASLALSFSYDASVMTLPAGAYTVNSIFAGAMAVNNLPPGPDGKSRITMSWSGSPKTLPDNSEIISFNFNVTGGGSSALKWNTGGDSCMYKWTGLKPLWKEPVSNFYQDGLVGTHLAPVTQAVAVNANPGQNVIVPVKVRNFSNIGAFSFTLAYDPAVLNYLTTALAAPLGGTFTASNPEPGLLSIVWSGGPAGLTDGATLLNLGFYFNGGTSGIQWLCDGGGCSYSEGGSSPSLYDLPKSQFYLNGTVNNSSIDLNAQLKVFLEGPYQSGSMGISLGSIMPLTQPYSGSPWNYAGTESVTSIPANSTDWILVELRTNPWASSKVAARAGFLKNDGSVTDIDGTTGLRFPGVAYGNYYVVIKHRNHLAIMSAATVTLNGGSALYDFTTGSAKAYGGTTGYKLIDGTLSKWGMVAGDANQSKSIYIDDYTDFWMRDFGLIQYLPSDFNLNGKVYLDDYTDFWLVNFGRSSSLP